MERKTDLIMAQEMLAITQEKLATSNKMIILLEAYIDATTRWQRIKIAVFG